MIVPINRAAWLHEPGKPLQVDEAAVPTAGVGQIVVKNAAIALNPLDNHMQDSGVFVKHWPAIIGCDVAGEVYEVGAEVTRFRKGDRIIGHCINLVTNKPCDGAYALYTTVLADKAAILPEHFSFTDGVVMPFAIEAATCVLSVKEPGPCMPGVSTPALGLPHPSADVTLSSSKILVVYGASSSVGSMTVQLAAAAGIKVFAIAGAHNHEMVNRCGATHVFDHKDENLVEKIVYAVKKALAKPDDFVGVFDAVSIPETYACNLAILEQLNGGHLACVHPPPNEHVPTNVTTGMIFAVNDIAGPVFRDFVTAALQNGILQCLPPPTVVGRGLECIDPGLQMLKNGVSATKLVIEL